MNKDQKTLVFINYQVALLVVSRCSDTNEIRFLNPAAECELTKDVGILSLTFTGIQEQVTINGQEVARSYPLVNWAPIFNRMGCEYDEILSRAQLNIVGGAGRGRDPMWSRLRAEMDNVECTPKSVSRMEIRWWDGCGFASTGEWDDLGVTKLIQLVEFNLPATYAGQDRVHPLIRVDGKEVPYLIGTAHYEEMLQVMDRELRTITGAKIMQTGAILDNSNCQSVWLTEEEFKANVSVLVYSHRAKCPITKQRKGKSPARGDQYQYYSLGTKRVKDAEGNWHRDNSVPILTIQDTLLGIEYDPEVLLQPVNTKVEVSDALVYTAEETAE